MSRRLWAAAILAAAFVFVGAAAGQDAGGSAGASAGSDSAANPDATVTRPGDDPSKILIQLPDPASSGDPEKVAAGRELFLQGCSSCHGFNATGLDGIAPTLQDAGAAAADFYLRTGRMPLSAPGDQPIRSQSRYSEAQIEALVAYVGSLDQGKGPPIPDVDPAAGDLAEGRELFTEYCAGCHQAVARGGIAPGGFAPSLQESTPTQVGEAIRVGPYIMPKFSQTTISDDEIDSLARYVQWATTDETVHPGGWDLGFLGPIPEGLVAWFIALAVLLAVARVIGERTTGNEKEVGADER